jgi:hypothetical protein
MPTNVKGPPYRFREGIGSTGSALGHPWTDPIPFRTTDYPGAAALPHRRVQSVYGSSITLEVAAQGFHFVGRPAACGSFAHPLPIEKQVAWADPPTACVPLRNSALLRGHIVCVPFVLWGHLR